MSENLNHNYSWTQETKLKYTLKDLARLRSLVVPNSTFKKVFIQVQQVILATAQIPG